MSKEGKRIWHLTFESQINDDVVEVRERLEWVEATMEEAIKGLETLTVMIWNRLQQFWILIFCGFDHHKRIKMSLKSQQKMSAIPANLKSEMGMGEEADVAKYKKQSNSL